MQGRKEDSRAEIHISDDKLSAECVLYPATGGGHELTNEYISLLCDQADIAVEIDWSLVRKKIAETQTVRRRTVFIIARGEEPVQAIPSHLKLKKRFFLAATQRIPEPKEEGGKVDYRLYSPYTIVSKGEPVARPVEAFNGKPGRTVTGEPIPPETREIVQYTVGENLELRDGRYYSLIDGLFSTSRNVISVVPVLQINGDIDFHTGHIQFPSDVKVAGGVKEGFHVQVKGNFSCSETVEATVFNVVKNVDITEGIIGRGSESVKIGGELHCKFLENAFVECRKDLHVTDSIYNSRVYTLGKVILGKEGKIVGGSVHSVKGITAFTAGNEIGLYGELYAGADFVSSRRITAMSQEIMRLSLKRDTLRQLENMGTAVGAALAKVDERVSELNDRIMEVRLGLDKNPSATIEIQGTVYPGILISICSAKMYIREKMTNTVFSLKEGRIHTAPA